MSIIVVGAGDIGYHLSQSLSLEKEDIIVIDKDIDKTNKIRDALDVQAIEGTGSSLKILQQAGIKESDMIIAVTGSDEVNLISCAVASSQTKSSTKVARVRNFEYIENPELFNDSNLNVDHLINPDYEAVTTIMKLLQFPGAIDVVDFNNGRIKIIGLKVENPIFYDGIELNEIREKSGLDDLVVASIYRDNEVIIPRGYDKIYFDNIVYAITTNENINSLLTFFGKEYEPIKRAMIVGGGNIDSPLLKEFEKMNISTKLIETDEAKSLKMVEELDKTLVLYHDGDMEKLFDEEHIENTDIFIAVTEDEENNILLSLLAKQKGAKKVISLIYNLSYTQFVSKLGIDLVVNPNLCAINRILHFIRKGKVLSATTFHDKKAEAIEAVALETSDIVNKPISKIKFPKDAIITAIIREGELIIPTGTSVIQTGDHVIIFALANAVKNVEKALTVKLEYW
jgi:trk system potassium uptake protein TrkA